MDKIIEIDDRLVVPPPWASILYESKKVPGELDSSGRFQAHHSTKPLIEKMVAANMLPPIANPADMYVSRGEYQPWAHQRLIMRLYTAHTRAYNYADLGCVDDQTEFLSPDGWKLIKDYAGEPVMVVAPDGRGWFELPQRYIDKPNTNGWVCIRTTRGLDQRLSYDHRVPVAVRAGRPRSDTVKFITAKDLYDRDVATVNGYKCKHVTAFKSTGQGIGFDEATLRVQVALLADGHLYTPSTSYWHVRLLKGRKKDRLESLLTAANIPFRRVQAYPEGYETVKFHFGALVSKDIPTGWYGLPNEALAVIADEMQHWDGSVNNRPSGMKSYNWSSSRKDHADFFQFALVASGNQASMHQRVDTFPDGHQVVMYYVGWTYGKRTAQHAGVGLTERRNNITLESAKGGDRQYCFTTSTGMWLMRRNGKVAVTGNSGKTNGSLWAFDLLKSLGRVDKLLVITPLSTVDAAWGEDAKNSVPHLSVADLIGTKGKRVATLERDRHDIYVINHDGAKTIEKPLIDWCKRHKVMTVYDEATAIKLYTTARAKTARHIFNASARRYVMTATPVVQNLMDAHGLLTAIDNVEFPRALTAFRQEFFVLAGPHKWVPKMTSFERLQRLMSPAIRLNTRDLIDLPENVLVRKWPPLTQEQDAAYRQMEETLVYEHDPTVIITAANAAVKMGKLIQVTCGIMHAEDTTITFDPKHKLAALSETIDESRSKVLIFAPYTAVIDRLVNYLEEQFYPGCAAVIDGRVPGNKRGDIVKRFQDPNDPLLYIVAHPRAASHGLTLTEADTTVWFAPYLSAESFVQANARIDRPGQKRTTRTVMLASTDLERDLYKALLGKKQTNTEFVEIYNAMIGTIARRERK